MKLLITTFHRHSHSFEAEEKPSVVQNAVYARFSRSKHQLSDAAIHRVVRDRVNDGNSRDDAMFENTHVTPIATNDSTSAAESNDETKSE